MSQIYQLHQGPQTPVNRSRLEELDGLRGLAILGVLAIHFLPEIKGSLSCGWMGVNLFFVLSGYLITRILLTQREELDRGQGSVSGALGVFYARRALRIFPLYYAVLIVLWVFDYGSARQLGWWLGTYTYNIYAFTTRWGEAYAHFWSLCVEEQFYLLWPLLILTCPRRHVVAAMGATFALGPIWRLGCFCLGTGRPTISIATFSSCDCLAAGGLLACALSTSPATRTRVLRWCGHLGIALMTAWLVVSMLKRPWLWGKVPVEALFGNTAMGVFFAWVIGRATQARNEAWAEPLRMKWLRHLGTISYGVYVLHMFVPLLWAPVSRAIPFLDIHKGYAHVVLSILAGAVSWHYFERPILRLKEALPYGPGGRQDESGESKSGPGLTRAA